MVELKSLQQALRSTYFKYDQMLAVFFANSNFDAVFEADENGNPAEQAYG